VTHTLKNLFIITNYAEALLFDKRNPGIYADFCDGDRVLNHPLFGSVDKFSLMLQLFFDGLGMTNPLRGQNTVNNIGVFYTVKNLPAKYNSCFSNVHLLALCYMEYLKVYGFNPILEKFVAEIVTLQQYGFEADLPKLGKCQVFSSLCQVTCNNLALNSILGFIESFSCDYFCTICYATQETIQTNYRSEMFEKRTISDYVSDVKNISGALKQDKNHFRGVKRNCILNDIEGFHVTENWSLDVMHVILEGIVPVELSCILYGLCSGKVLDTDTLNHCISIFWGHLTVNKSDRPPALNRLMEPGHGLSPSMKAVQCWALLKYLPLAVGKQVPFDNVHWLFLLHLSHLVDLIFAPRFTRGMVMYLKDVIEDHLQKFVKLYSSTWHVKLRPKHHFLVHLPEIVLKSGPLTGMSCLKYELKNSFFKRCAHTICNFTNVCHALAKRHQQQSVFYAFGFTY